MAAAARGSGRASAPQLLLLLLFALPWAPTGVRSVPDEDLSHRNKEPPAPPQQLQPQPAAVQGPEPARAEVSRTGRAGCGAGALGTRLAAAGSALLGPGCRRGGGEPAAAPCGWRRWRALLPGSGPASPGSLWGRGRERPARRPREASRPGAPGCCGRGMSFLLTRGVLKSGRYPSRVGSF